MASKLERTVVCDCGLMPKHNPFEHDWCCQICGGSHTERICPEKKKNSGSVGGLNDGSEVEQV